MIYFKQIFDRAFSLFDDPVFSREYYEDQANFQKHMLEYLMIGKNKFTYPACITDKLVEMDAKAPVGFCESDSGSGSETYVLEKVIPNNGEGVGITYKIGSESVSGSYDPATNSVEFPRAVSADEEWSVTWFYAGAFTADFSSCLRSDFPMDAIMDKIVNILAYALLSAYGDKEVGRVIEVRNILTDTDFKMYSPANSAKAKVEWRNQMNKDMDTLVSELNWRIMSTPKGGSRFGK